MHDQDQKPFEQQSREHGAAEPNIFTRRRERIREYVLTGIDKNDPNESSLIAERGDLIEFAVAIRESIDEDLRLGPKSLDEITPLVPVFSAYTKLTRQVDRIGKALNEIEDRRQRPENGRTEAKK